MTYKMPEMWSFSFNGYSYDEKHTIRFAENLKALRMQKGLSLNKLAQQINSTKLTIWKYENCDNRPTLEVACRLALVLGVSLDFLVYGHITKKDS
ncbi:MAG: helix-turn-helix transcriptional regulator [Alphaproteobacteria bacterium]|nr:helix-turn-helix transcriptional regulator [Alphaproteobacteria bacterium]